ncbi:plasmid pRiA4b ORF-3 family protein [Oceanispirochaeta sp.]|jgi:hypothetical protein|uniref:plasmid pRiA4b ORF-3 family protein n=1 Tax=Oceanispirochaeta sp. TaxID=2035350 RepID=UPI002608A495|nr:plasmid pRiA4b ORF-3 family protein [Oceanispirochaeta sp.]MDA3956102.1 plasmid pRiA4b ORF-3 family protein [Oceanispirochaeta sp.]
MDDEKLDQLNGYLKAMDLPFAHPLVEALIREDLAGRGEGYADLTTRIYTLAGSVPPGENAPLLFEQLIFDLFKLQKAQFDRDDDEIVAPLRLRLLTLFDRWMQLNDFLQEKEQNEQKGILEVLREMDELLQFVQNLLNRVNHPSEENPESLGELDFLIQQSEEVLIRIMERIDEILHPPVSHEHVRSDSILTLKITLSDLPGTVWRRIRVSGQMTLAQFHAVLQKSMGWWDLYNHRFEQAGQFWGHPGSEDQPVLPEEECLLLSLLEEEDDLLHYYYDLAESWYHKIIVEKVESPEKEQTGYVLECLAGEGACPPEDCGGPEGFRMLLASLNPSASQDLKEDFSWVGDFDPTQFSVMTVNKELKELL